MGQARAFAGVFSVVLAVTAFTTSVAPVNAQSADSILVYQGPDREKRLLEGARKEGQVVIYSAMIVNQALRPLVDSFNRKYPGVRASYWRGDSRISLQNWRRSRAPRIWASMLLKALALANW